MGTFVRSVAAIDIAVARPPLLNALAVGASELVVRAARIASILIGSIHTIRIEIADPSERDTFTTATFARKLILGANPQFAYLGVLVAAVGAVGFAVALPARRNAPAAISAFEFGLGALPRIWTHGGDVFVAVVAAVVLAVAGPH